MRPQFIALLPTVNHLLHGTRCLTLSLDEPNAIEDLKILRALDEEYRFTGRHCRWRNIYKKQSKSLLNEVSNSKPKVKNTESMHGTTHL